MTRRLLGWLALSGLLLALGGCGEPPPYTNIDNRELQALIEQKTPLYDVRRAEEWRQTGVIAGSRQLTFVDASGRPNPEFLPRFTAEVDKDKPVILICRTGNRSDVLARELMREHGYTRVYNVRDGITGWIGERLPVIRQ
ncbi:MAG: rhodanese-like domain-containing protein [Pseudomonadota bacterium]